MGHETSRMPARYRPSYSAIEDKQLLYQLYWGFYLTRDEVGEVFGKRGAAMSKRMRRLGIPRRPFWWRRNLHSVRQIAECYEVEQEDTGVDWARYND